MKTFSFLAILGLVGCLAVAWGGPSDSGVPNGGPLAKATFAGGCFWCMEPPYDELEGVISTTSGYTGGQKANPTYEEVSAGITGHAEAVQVLYDPTKISYAKLLDVFWRNIDPTTPDRQFCDVGLQYRTGIFYHNDEQKQLAEQSKQAVGQSKTFPEHCHPNHRRDGVFPCRGIPPGFLSEKSLSL